jgi:signal transduction histidine kinase
MDPAPPHPARSDDAELSILLFDESPGLAREIVRQFEDAHLTVRLHRVETRAEFETALARDAPDGPDLVLCDHAVPEGDAASALHLARARSPDAAFIFLADQLDEESVVESLKGGASDVVLKSHLERLPPAVRRARRELAESRAHRHADEQLLHHHEQLRALTAYLQYVREEERARIAREIHDELGQMLTTLKIELASLAGRLPKDRRVLREKASHLLGHLDALMHTVRQIVTELRPGILDELGLVAALEWQAQEFQRRTGIRCTFAALTREERWEDDVTVALFRIFQETLTNVLRHAQATLVTVRLSRDSSRLTLEIADNGRGITETEVNNPRSIGLLGMRERAALLGGEILFHGATGQGTTVVIRLPIPPETPNTPHEDSADRRPRHRAPRIETDPPGGVSHRGIRRGD